MKVTITVPKTSYITFEMEIPTEYDKGFLYEDGLENPPSSFDWYCLSYRQQRDLKNYIEDACHALTGKTCDYLVDEEDIEMDW